MTYGEKCFQSSIYKAFKYGTIVVTSDLGRVTTRYSFNLAVATVIVVTSDLGRVTTCQHTASELQKVIVVTSDLGRVTTQEKKMEFAG